MLLSRIYTDCRCGPVRSDNLLFRENYTGTLVERWYGVLDSTRVIARGFNFSPFRSRETTFVKLFTRMHFYLSVSGISCWCRSKGRDDLQLEM